MALSSAGTSQVCRNPAPSQEKDARGVSMGELVYRRNDTPRSTRDWVLYTTQWLVTMFYAVVWGYAIVGAGLGFRGAQLTEYLSAIVLTIGLGTLLQAWFGHRMAMVSGPNVIPSLAIVSSFSARGLDYALQSFTAQAIAGLVLALLVFAGLIRFIHKLWSPLVLGSMLIMVGLSVAATGIASMAQDGLSLSFFIALALALGGSVLAIRGRGIAATLPPLLVIGLGYVVFFALGRIQTALIEQAPWLATPRIFLYSLSLPPWDLIVIMIVVNLMAALNLYGNLHGYAEVIGEKVDAADEQRSFTIFALVETALAGILGVPATVAYGENLGIVQLTRVAARAFIIVAAAIFAALAFIGPFGALMAAMPREVAGAVLLGIASSVIGIGARTLNTAPAFDRREQTLVGFSIFLSLGLYLLPPAAWTQTPTIIGSVFGNPVISVIIFVMLFERVIFPKQLA